MSKGARRGRPEAKILVRVQALLNRALGTDQEEEARTCALLAVRLMKEYGLRVTAGRGLSASSVWQADYEPAPPKPEAWSPYPPDPEARSPKPSAGDWRSREAPRPPPPPGAPPWAGRTHDPYAPGPYWDGARGQYRDPFVEAARARYSGASAADRTLCMFCGVSGGHALWCTDMRGTMFCVPGCSPLTGHAPNCPRYRF